MSDAIRVNGNMHDWGSIVIKVDGEEFHGFVACEYSHKRERGKAYGTGKHHAPRGRGRGKYTPGPGKLTGPAATIEELRKKLADMHDGVNYGDTEFLMTVQFIEEEKPILCEVGDCVIAGEDSKFSESDTGVLMEEVELDVMWLKKNGRTLFDNSQGTI